MSSRDGGKVDLEHRDVNRAADGVGSRLTRLYLGVAFHLRIEVFVPDFEGLHLSPPIAAAVARLGWSADDPVMRDSAPTAARGHNLVTLVPPDPASLPQTTR